MVLIPDVTDAIRPSATAAMNTMTGPSAEEADCSMIRMYCVDAAGEPPRVTWSFHSGLSTVPSEPGSGRRGQQRAEQRGVPAARAIMQEAAEEYRRAGQDL